MELTDEALKQAIKDTEAELLALRRERMARELKLAESFLLSALKKAIQYFGPEATVKAETDEYDLQAMLFVGVPYSSLPYEEFRKSENSFYEDPEVLALCNSLFIHVRFV